MQTNFVSSCTGSSTVGNASQPAEAEGVSVPVEGYILDNNGYSFTRRREDFWTAKAAIVPLVRQSRHLAALSAVTAELENVREIQAETINARNSYQWELERVTAEVEGLRKALEQIAAAERTVYRDGYTEVENDSAIDCPGIAQTALAEYRAALAAKEA